MWTTINQLRCRYVKIVASHSKLAAFWKPQALKIGSYEESRIDPKVRRRDHPQPGAHYSQESSDWAADIMPSYPAILNIKLIS